MAFVGWLLSGKPSVRTKEEPEAETGKTESEMGAGDSPSPAPEESKPEAETGSETGAEDSPSPAPALELDEAEIEADAAEPLADDASGSWSDDPAESKPEAETGSETETEDSPSPAKAEPKPEAETGSETGAEHESNRKTPTAGPTESASELATEPAKASTLTLEADGESVSIHMETDVGTSIVGKFGEDAQFWSEPQFTLEKTDAGWSVTHHPGAKNETMLNGKAVTGSQPLADGDVLAVGRESKGIVKLPLTVRMGTS